MKQQYIPKNNKKKHKFGRGNGGYGSLKPEQITSLEVTAIETPDVAVSDEAESFEEIESIKNAEIIEENNNVELSDNLSDGYYVDEEQSESSECEVKNENFADENDVFGTYDNASEQDFSDEPVYYGEDDTADKEEEYSQAVYLNEDGETDFNAYNGGSPDEREQSEEEISDEQEESAEEEISDEQEEVTEPVDDEIISEREESVDEEFSVEPEESAEEEISDEQEETTETLSQEEDVLEQTIEETVPEQSPSQDELIRLAVEAALRKRDEEELERKTAYERQEASKREQEDENNRKAFEEMMLSWKQELAKRDSEITEMRKQQELAEQQRQEELRKQQELAEQQRQEELRKQQELAEQQRQEELRKQQELEDQRRREEFQRQKEELIKLQEDILRRQQEFAEQQRQEELRRQQELEERQRQEELRRQQELEERQRQEELRRQQELEEQQRQEELRRQQELAEQQRQEELRKQQELEERQRQEELRRQQELEERQRQEELRRQQELEEQQTYYRSQNDYEEEDYMNTKSVAKIKVIGVGGAGSNAVNRMIELGVDTAEFVAVNTDKQALMLSLCDENNRIQIGANITKGLGAGADPTVGEQSAEESKKALEDAVKGVDLLFIAAGMGGGTGTGAAPIVAKTAKDAGCVTVAVVTRPFHFEGKKRELNAKKGIANLAKYVDTIIIIPNDRLLEALPPDTPFIDALKYADDTLRQGICGIADLIATPSLINLDFADVRTILKNQGLAHMGVGKAKGENRVIEAVRQAVSSPLLETTIEGAHGIILNVTGGKDLSMSQVGEAANRVQEIIDPTANIIFGMNVNPDLQEEIIITIIATGFDKKVDDEDAEQKPRKDFAFVNNRQTLGQVAQQERQNEQPTEEYMNIQRFNRNDAPKDNREGFYQNHGEREAEPSFTRRQQEPRYEEGVRMNEQPDYTERPAETNVKNERKTDVPAFVRRLFGKK